MAKKEKSGKKIVERAKKRFKLAQDAWSENRENALDDIRFSRLAEQWPDDIRSARERDGRPCLTINRLPQFIRQVVNDARQNSPAIKVMPVDDHSDPETAEVVNGVIRNIEATSNAETAYDNALESAVTCGLGFFRIAIKYAHDDTFEMDLAIERIANPLSVIFDPHSEEVDGSDWAYCFVEDTMSKDEYEDTYPDSDISDWQGSDLGEDGWVTEDKVRVAEYWEREEVDTEILRLSDGTTLRAEKYAENQQLFDAKGLTVEETRETKTFKVTQYIIGGGEEPLETTEWAGRYIPIIPVLGDEVIVEEKRYFLSLVRQTKDAQRNFNYWRSAATESLGLRSKMPWIGPVGAFDTDRRKWETANTEAHPFIEYDGVQNPLQQQPGVGDLGAIQEAAMASDDMKSITGMYDAALGQRSNETSGVAIKARQREGDVATFHFIDNLSRGIRYGGRVLLDLLPHVYNKPRVVRLMGVDGTPETAQINEQIVVNGMSKMHDLTNGKYDLIVKTGPSFTTRREEAAEQMTDLIKAFPDAAPIIGDLVAKNLDWPGADEIAQRLKAMLPPEIAALEKMDGLPPEAQAAVAQAKQQVQQLEEILEQGKQLLQQKDEEIKALSTEQQSKMMDIKVKEEDSKRKFAAGMAKVDADLKIVKIKENEENRRLIMDEAITVLKDQVQANQEAVVTQLQQVDNRMMNKQISITAPSGETYDASVIDGEVTVDAPSGKTYTGKIQEIA